MSYPNMSYCMCENTLLAMRQILNAMEDEGQEFVQDMGREERRAYEELYNACEAFMRMAEELQVEEDDGQPTEHEEWMSFDPDC
jgi:hypothetical protein